MNSGRSGTADAPVADGGPRRRRRWAALAMFAMLALAAYFFAWRPIRTQALLESARAALQSGNADAALRTAESVLRWTPDSAEGLLVAARARTALGQYVDAVRAYDRIEDADPSTTATARAEAGRLLLERLHQWTAAEARFQRAVELAPDSVEAQAGLALMLGASGRPASAVRPRMELIRLGRADSGQLFLIARGRSALDNAEQLIDAERSAPDDPAVQLGLARVALEYENFDRAADLLQRVVTARPEWTEAYAWLGEVRRRQAVETDFREWSDSLPAHAEQDARVWLVRGEWAEQHGQLSAAVRCYGESVRRDPTELRAVYKLGQALTALDHPQEAARFLDRAAKLAEYVKQSELAHRVGDPAHFQRSAELAAALGLLWESYGWSQAAIDERQPEIAWAEESVARLTPLVAGLPAERFAADRAPALALDVSEFPLPDWDNGADPQHRSLVSPNKAAPGRSPSSTSPPAAVSFRDDAQSAGLHFQYDNAGDPQSRGIVRMYEVVGGGAAVLDYDADGWPDVHLPQGGDWSASNELSDQLFRNRGDGTFRNVSGQCGVADVEFSQGAAAGDYDGDGFTDLYIANSGMNRLFRNNGDGTFADVTEFAGVGDDRYSVSAALADFNGDGHADLLTVNYLAGSDVFTRVCGDPERPRSCLPQSFAGERSQLFINSGDGRFDEQTSGLGLDVATPGRGLGLVAADFDGSGRLGIYIANDVGPNFLFVPLVDDRGAFAGFHEEGLLRGVALNRNGDYESGMGIAAGDVDGNGLLDLFVTNFDDQTNTLYAQREPGYFEDVTPTAGFAPKRQPYVGWGAQFLDADLDGRPDLILTNGHVNDVRDHGRLYQMPAQFFYNAGQGAFVECAPETLGPFFLQPRLGRGMARLDWNRDAREDVVISHLDAPAALLTNLTPPAGGALVCRLVGTRSPREAIGATLHVRCGDQSATRQLVAGDGNQSSNQRLLVVATGSAALIDELEIRWPSGRRDRLAGIPAHGEIVCVEGRSKWYAAPR